MKVVDNWDRICQIRDTVQKRPYGACQSIEPQSRLYFTYIVHGDLAGGDIVAGKDRIGATVIAPMVPDK